MRILPTIKTISGVGTPRLMLVPKTERYRNTGATTYTSTTVIEAGTPAFGALGVKVGDWILVYVAASGTVYPSWAKITVIDETLGKLTVAAWIGATPADGTTFQIVQYDYFSTGATTYTATTVTEAGSPDLSNAKINQRIYSTKLGTNPPKEVYARITFVDDTTDTITVDEWIGGTPTNGQGFFVSGWIADLPRTQELTEHWEQDALTHSLLRHRKVSKYFGWYYSCTLDYSKYAPGDLFVRLRHHLNMKGEDRLVLIPRRDAEQFQYTVRFAAGFDVSMLGEGLANRKPVFVFESTETVSNFNLVLSGWGRSYAQDYGNGSS